ncbi:MAG: STAS domain-containing protein [Armatimonadota bacterium]
MDVEIIHAGTTIVRINGEIDYGTAGKFNIALEEAFHESPHGFVIDLSGVSYMDSSGLQSILNIYRRMLDSGGRLALIIKHQNIKVIFDVINISQFPNVFICNNIESAEKVISDNNETDECSSTC